MANHNGNQIENFQLRKLIELSELQVLLLEAIHHHQHEDARVQQRILRTLRVIAFEVHNATPRLSEIKILFTKGPNMPTPGPITLAPGESAVASVVGFDQSGAPFTGTLPPSTLSSDDTSGAIVTFDPSTGATVAVAAGVANISASLTTAEGVALSDTETVTVTEAPPPVQVLSSIKVAFDVASPK